MTSPLEPYVRAALALQGYDFDDAHVADITLQFERFQAMAKTFDDIDLPAELDPAALFLP